MNQRAVRQEGGGAEEGQVFYFAGDGCLKRAFFCFPVRVMISHNSMHLAVITLPSGRFRTIVELNCPLRFLTSFFHEYMFCGSRSKWNLETGSRSILASCVSGSTS